MYRSDPKVDLLLLTLVSNFTERLAAASVFLFQF